MNFQINKNEINKQNFFDFLHDKVVGRINIKDNFVEFNIWNSYRLEQHPEYQMIVNFGKNSSDYINVYLYKIEDGNISGKISDINSLVNDNTSFEIIDIGYMNSVLFLKGSIIKDHKLNRNNILIQFCFDNSESFIEIKNNI